MHAHTHTHRELYIHIYIYTCSHPTPRTHALVVHGAWEARKIVMLLSYSSASATKRLDKSTKDRVAGIYWPGPWQFKFWNLGIFEHCQWFVSFRIGNIGVIFLSTPVICEVQDAKHCNAQKFQNVQYHETLLCSKESKRPKALECLAVFEHYNAS